MELDSFFLRICISNGRFWTAFCSLSNDLSIIETLVVIIAKAYRDLALKIDTVDVHTSMHKRKLYALIYAPKRRLLSFVTMKQTQNVHKWTNRPVKVQFSMDFGYIC